MKLPDNLREQLKIPLGLLLLESEANKKNIQKHISENSFVITVGDRTTEKMIEFGRIVIDRLIFNERFRNNFF